MPKSQIIIDVVEDNVPLEKSLSRLMILAHDVKNNTLENWAKNELNGYERKEDLPDYRKSFSSLFKYSGINGGFSVSNVTLDISWFEKDHIDDVCNVNIVDGIKYLTDLANSDSSPSRDVTFLANDVRKKSNGMIVCTSITQITPQSIYMSVLSKIKNMLITALCELEEKYGNLDKLGIDVSKKKSFQIETFNSDMNKAVFNISIPNEAENKKQPWYSKVGWNIVVPIFTAIIGAVIAAIMIKILGF